jgi:hypothetical protein
MAMGFTSETHVTVPLPGGALIMAATVANVSESAARRMRGTVRAGSLATGEETVVSKMTDSEWSQLTRDLSARVAAFAPEWTDPVESDPGVTLLELFAFLTESLLDRADVPPHVSGRIREIAAQVERLAASRCADGTLTRPRYFEGKLLTAADLDQEQDYVRTKHRRHNRLLHGVGVVSGLGVSLTSQDGESAVVVSPGLAIGPTGEELLICERVTLPLRPDETPMFVTVGLVEQPVDPNTNGEPTRIEEFAAAALVDNVPAGHLVVARLTRAGDAAQIDPAFEPARVNR